MSTTNKNPGAADTARGAKDTGGSEITLTLGERKAKLIEAARTYRDNHHWVPLRLQGKNPACMGKGWEKRTTNDAIPNFEEGDNIGFLLGAPSGGVIRLDPDYQSIPDVTSLLFPEPTAIFGRKTSPRSGRLYVCDGLESTDFKLPDMKGEKRLPIHDGKPNVVVFQILSTGKQTMAPPSLHPGTGEEVQWTSETPIKTLDKSELLRRVGIEAFLMAVRQFWPPRGTRNEAAMALARVLLEIFKTHVQEDEQRIELVDALVLAVAMAGGDGEESRDGKARAAATLEKMRAGEEATGLPKLIELLELPPKVTKTFRQWLGLATIKVPFITDTAVTLEDFNAYMPQHLYIFTPTRELHMAR
jgi:hypothetical protein